MWPTNKAAVITHSELPDIGCNSILNIGDSVLIFLAFEQAIEP
jgi:hypothetical protein